MSRPGAEIEGSTASEDAARAWESLRADGSIQYGPVSPAKPPETPDWLKRFGEWLESLLGPVGEALGLSWPIVEKVLLALAALLVLFLLWRLAQPLLARLREAAPEPEPEWTPDRTAAIALLEEADRLAAEGRYGEAAHLLLQRSVHHIAEARPDWLRPSSTAREIAGLPLLPQRAREAFGAIAQRVEHSLYALRDLTLTDWTEARAAYADFALQRIGGDRA